jgi:hypothetical protein
MTLIFLSSNVSIFRDEKHIERLLYTLLALRLRAMKIYFLVNEINSVFFCLLLERNYYNIRCCYLKYIIKFTFNLDPILVIKLS